MLGQSENVTKALQKKRLHGMKLARRHLRVPTDWNSPDIEKLP